MSPRFAERVWLAAAAAIAAMMAMVLFALLWPAAQGSAGLWSHLARHVLPQAAANTAVLLAGVGIVAAAIGTVCAWLVSAYDFPGRRVFGWALLLPLAVPTYIVAFAYLDLLHPLGPLQTALRALLGFDSPREFRLPDIRSMGACIALLGLVLYPYVYLTVRAMFAMQAASLVEAARSLGTGGAALFWRVALPLARPAIAAGLALVLLETLNDIAASEFLGVKTLTVAIYTTWVTRSDLPGAAQIALAMLTVVMLVLAIERYGRRRQGYAVSLRPRPLAPQRLRGRHAAFAALACALPVLLGFVAPAAYLAVETWQRLQGEGVSPQLWRSAWNSLRIAALTTAVALSAGVVLIWALRLAQLRRREALARAYLRVGSLGYALPGTVLAIALLTPMAWFDRAAAWLTGGSQALLMGSLAALVLACALRFLTIATGGLEAGLARVPLSLDQAARALGSGPGDSLRRVHLPLLRPALAAAALLVFVDTMKELPATLMLRPLNVDTLATWLYAEAARGTYEEGAVAALLIVLVGLPAVVLLARGGFGPVREVRDAEARAELGIIDIGTPSDGETGTPTETSTETRTPTKTGTIDMGTPIESAAAAANTPAVTSVAPHEASP
jgi:iron(III) transport system permease protein